MQCSWRLQHSIFKSFGCKKLSLSLGIPCVRHKTNICIVGSGPAGFYTAKRLLRESDVNVDIIEKLPIPYGLMRFGVAPDHPEIKVTTEEFHNIAEDKRCSFYGNIKVGQDISLKELLEAYNAVVLAYGAAEDKSLGIPGENSHNVLSARQIVGWYNGAPEHVEEDINLNTEVVTIVGHGNVAIDVARVLLCSTEELEKTDITSYALGKLRQSNVRKVILVGRRGPQQVAFTIKELRELTKLKGCHTIINPDQMAGVQELLPSLKKKRMPELLLSLTKGFKKSHGQKEIEIKFYRSPKEILRDENNRAEGIVLGINKPEASIISGKVIPTGEDEMIPCGLIVKSIGYRSIKIDPLMPFDEKSGTIPNENGRVIGSEALYCSGWVKSGPVGVIPTTMQSSYETAMRLIKDLKAGSIPTSNVGGRDEILSILKKRDVLVTTFEHWKKIDAVEVQRGLSVGKPREKVCKISEMLQIAGLL